VEDHLAAPPGIPHLLVIGEVGLVVFVVVDGAFHGELRIGDSIAAPLGVHADDGTLRHGVLLLAEYGLAIA
jgi:hypothetical protein